MVVLWYSWCLLRLVLRRLVKRHVGTGLGVYACTCAVLGLIAGGLGPVAKSPPKIPFKFVVLAGGVVLGLLVDQIFP